MNLIATSISACSDTFSLFHKDRSFYALPQLEKSRSSFRSDAQSFLQSLHGNSSIDLSGSCSLLDSQRSGSVRKSCGICPAVENNSCQNDRLPDFDAAKLEEVGTRFLEDRRHDSLRSQLTDSFVTAAIDLKGEASGLQEKHREACGRPRRDFQKWMKKVFRGSTVKGVQDFRMIDAVDDISLGACSTSATSESTIASSQYLGRVNSASITIDSRSLREFPRRDSYSGLLDNETKQRMQDRMHAVLELIKTEECYIEDLKSIRDHYLSTVMTCVWVPANVKKSISRNILDMMDLHQRLLSELILMLPCISKSLDGQPPDTDTHVSGWARTPTLSDPSATAEVARVFDRMIPAFFVYEEYSSSYEAVVTALRKFWKSSLQPDRKGFETLTTATNSWATRSDYRKRALEIDDMLVKPIQRICKYPLLFGQITKHTPAIDCPESNRILERVRHRLDETAHQVNLAPRGAHDTQSRIEKTYLLHQRLSFPDDFPLPSQLLGHAVLCGTLHVIWQCDSSVEGGYMACFLFKSYLLLATVSRYNKYDVKFAIGLSLSRILEIDQGIALHCPSAPHSWKLAFRDNYRDYEVVLTAACQQEEDVWCDSLQERIIAESSDYRELHLTNHMSCTVPSALRPVSGSLRHSKFFKRPLFQKGSLLLESDFTYIVINHILAVPDASSPFGLVQTYTNPLGRNGSEGVPTFNLKVSERSKMVAKLLDVWTKDVLPVGTTGIDVVQRRQSSTTSAIRRFSMVNAFVTTVTTVTKRSVQSLRSCDSSSSEGSAMRDDSVSRMVEVKRSSTISFQKMKATGRNQPPIPAKRSTSLSSRFSFSTSIRKDSPEMKLEQLPAFYKRRSLRSTVDEKFKIMIHQECPTAMRISELPPSCEGFHSKMLTISPQLHQR